MKKRGRPKIEPPPTSDGVARLRRYIKKTGMTQSQLADKLGMARGQLSHYVMGTRTPLIHQALTIQTFTKRAVTIESWAQDVEDFD